MFDRENAVGFLVLAVCVAVGGIMLFSIATGERFRFTSPGWIVWVLLLLFLGGTFYGLFRGRMWGNPRWPDPRTGRRPWWQFWRRGDGGR